MSQSKPVAKFVVFSGLDGAGKTTQIEALLCAFRRDGYRARRIWARGGYTPIMLKAKAMARRLARGHLPAPGRSAAREASFRSPRTRKMWLALAILDLALYYVFWIRVLRAVGTVVISDRYVEDTLLDFQLNFPQERVEAWAVWRVLTRLAPIPDKTFILTVPVAESLRRARGKAEPFPDSPDTLSVRLAAYHAMAQSTGTVLLDGLIPRDELQAAICQHCGLSATLR